MKTATLVKTMKRNASGGHHAVYRLDPPYVHVYDEDGDAGNFGWRGAETIEHVMVMADPVTERGNTHMETGVFRAWPDEKYTWDADLYEELPGSCRGTLNHRVALADLGYEVVTK